MGLRTSWAGFVVVLPLLQAACSPSGPSSLATVPTAPSVLGSAFVPVEPPPTERMLAVPTKVDVVRETLFGKVIEDPYRWLEDGTSDAVKAWTASQNAHTRKTLDGASREKLRTRIEELTKIGFVSSPVVATHRGKTRYFHVRRDGTQDQPVVLVRDKLEDKDRVLLDPTTFAEDKSTAAIDWWYPSPDGQLVAFGISRGGDEQSTLRIRDVTTGKDLSDTITRTRATSLSWMPDGKSFFYTREPAPDSVPKGEEHYHRSIYFHRLGDDVKNDLFVFKSAGKMTDSPAIQVSPSGTWALITVFQGWARSSLYLGKVSALISPPKATAGKGVSPLALMTDADASAYGTFHRPTKKSAESIYIRTNHGASNYKILRAAPEKPAEKDWVEVLKEGPDAMRDFELVGDRMFVSVLHKAHSRIDVRTLGGEPLGSLGDADFPTLGVPHGETDGHEVLYEETGFTHVPEIRRFEWPKPTAKPIVTKPSALSTTTFTKIDLGEVKLDPSQFEVQQVEAVSKDGTKVTAFVVNKKGVVRDGNSPLLLHGYGGFNIAQTPSFNRSLYAWLEQGGVYVLANLRGGAEYGEAWHKAGMLGNKQNVFDDSIAVAEYLIANKWTSKGKLAISGGSNGGLLVAALATQRPDLYRAILCAVPLTDMLRFHKFLIAKLWMAEYGNPDEAEAFKWLAEYSPYHKVRDGVAYPAMLITTGENDSRVDPLHARKFAARLQKATSSDAPILLRVESKVGHGAGKPRSKQIEEIADQYSFLFHELGFATGK